MNMNMIISGLQYTWMVAMDVEGCQGGRHSLNIPMWECHGVAKDQ